MAHDNGATGVRPPRVSADRLAQQGFLAEAFTEDGGFHVTGPPGADPHRLRGTALDPAEGRSAEERKRLGRQLDILWEGTVFPVSITFADGADRDPGAPLRKALAAPLRRTYDVEHGYVELRGVWKLYRGTCAEAGCSFTVVRPVSNRRRWPAICEGCRTHRERRLAAERQRRRRARQS